MRLIGTCQDSKSDAVRQLESWWRREAPTGRQMVAQGKRDSAPPWVTSKRGSSPVGAIEMRTFLYRTYRAGRVRPRAAPRGCYQLPLGAPRVMNVTVRQYFSDSPRHGEVKWAQKPAATANSPVPPSCAASANRHCTNCGQHATRYCRGGPAVATPVEMHTGGTTAGCPLQSSTPRAQMQIGMLQKINAGASPAVFSQSPNALKVMQSCNRLYYK
jgi:hypothetical protein